MVGQGRREWKKVEVEKEEGSREEKRRKKRTGKYVLFKRETIRRYKGIGGHDRWAAK